MNNLILPSIFLLFLLICSNKVKSEPKLGDLKKVKSELLNMIPPRPNFNEENFQIKSNNNEKYNFNEIFKNIDIAKIPNNILLNKEVGKKIDTIGPISYPSQTFQNIVQMIPTNSFPTVILPGGLSNDTKLGDTEFPSVQNIKETISSFLDELIPIKTHVHGVEFLAIPYQFFNQMPKEIQDFLKGFKFQLCLKKGVGEDNRESQVCRDVGMHKQNHFDIEQSGQFITLKLLLPDEHENTVISVGKFFNIPSNPIKVHFTHLQGGYTILETTGFINPPTECFVVYIDKQNNMSSFDPSIINSVLPCSADSICDCTQGKFTIDVPKSNYDPVLLDNLLYRLPRVIDHSSHRLDDEPNNLKGGPESGVDTSRQENDGKNKKSGLSTSAIIGIVAACLITVCAVALIIFFLRKKYILGYSDNLI